MSEVLSIIDVNNYGLQKMKNEGGGEVNLQSKEVEITENGTTTVTPDVGYDGLNDVEITVEGILDTSDADAIASDIATGKSGYVNGVKVIGNVPVGSSTVATNYASTNVSTYQGDLLCDAQQITPTQMFRQGDKLSILSPASDVATAIGLVPEILKKDVTILGVTGTYEGEPKFAGIRVDFVNETIAVLDGSYPVNQLNCYSGRRRCNMSDNGTITAYYGDANYDNVGSSISQVMVEQPKVYYSLQNVVVTNGAIDKADYIVADSKIDNTFELHPAFIKNNIEYDYIYANAYEATVVDNKLSSIGGGTNAPIGSVTRADCRTYANNRGNIWTQLTKQYDDLESLLMAIELRSFNFQSSLSVGVTSGTVQNVGQAYTLDANGTGIKGASIATSDCFTWRWRENKYGNINKWNEGINCYDNIWYIADHNFADDTSVGYEQLSETASTTLGWITQFAYVPEAKWIFMPKVTSSTQEGLIQDKYYVGTSWKILYSGGNWAGGINAGNFRLSADASSFSPERGVGAGLLALRPQ